MYVHISVISMEYVVIDLKKFFFILEKHIFFKISQ